MYSQIVKRSIAWGASLGSGLSVLFGLWMSIDVNVGPLVSFIPFAALVGLFFGIPLGLLNGILVSNLILHFTTKDVLCQRILVGTGVFILTSIGSASGFYLLLSMTPHMPHTEYVIPGAAIATLAAVFASQRVLSWYWRATSDNG